jgi:uncharacterized membrane protein
LPQASRSFNIRAVNTLSDQRSYRLTSIDMLRGLVIIIMAIDHARDFFHAGATIDPLGDPDVSPWLYFTRWITHFCAPVFVCLAGVSAGLMAARKSPAELARFLFTRGVWLLFVEFVVISTAVSFSPGGIEQLGGKTLVFLQVIWAIGASMVVLSALQFLGRRVCLALGVLIVLGHNALDAVWPQPAGLLDSAPPVWVALHAAMSKIAGPFHVLFLYPLLPWIGVMLLGFGASALFEKPAPARDASLRRWGLALIALFVVLRAIDVYGDPNHWESHERGLATFFDFLNTTKYPPSLLFLAMTLGPAAALCSYADRFRGFVKDSLVMFGRVPFAFYVAHFYLLHLMSVGLGMAQGFSADQMATFPIFYPRGYGVNLAWVYVGWAAAILMLYPLCQWMAGVKARSKAWWLSYL